MALATEFIIRFLYNRPVRKVTTVQAKPNNGHYLEKNIKLMLFGLFFSSLAIFIRYVPLAYQISWNFADWVQSSVYRTIELSDGWNGRIISTQRYFSASHFSCYGR